MTLSVGRRSGAAIIALTLLLGCGERETLLVGERQDLRGGASAEADAPRQISLPPQVTTAGWTHRAFAPDHAMPHAALADTPVIRFAADIGEGETRRRRIVVDPVVSGGRIFAVDAVARLSAFSAAGERLWTQPLAPDGESVGATPGGGLAVDGGILVAATSFGEVIALDAATGRRIWTQDIGAAAAGPPTISGGRVFVVGRDATGWAIELSNGRVAWTEEGTPSGSGYVGGASPAVEGDLVILPFSSREMAALLRDGGTRLWTATVAGSRPGAVYAQITDITGDPVITGGRVYAGSVSGRIDAYDLNGGAQVWSATEGAMSPVIVAGGSVFAVTDQAELVRLDAANGERVWGTDLPYLGRPTQFLRGGGRGVVAHYGPVLAGGRLWVAGTDGQLRGFSAVSGEMERSVTLPAGAATNPVVVGGVLYVVTVDGRLLAVG